MFIRFLIITGLLASYSNNAFALTVKQFSDFCKSSPIECSDHSILQAYVGGSLDLLATLDQNTNYLTKIYCNSPEALFNVPAIIRFMQVNSDDATDENAMTLVVRYFEENGGCSQHE